MISLETGTYIALNETAAAMWDLLAEPLDETVLVDEMVKKFAVRRDTCETSVSAMLSQMAQNQLIVSKDDQAGY